MKYLNCIKELVIVSAILQFLKESNALRILNIKAYKYLDSSNFGDVYLNCNEVGPWSNWIVISIPNNEAVYIKNQATGHFLKGLD
jgi:hypothetical protein